MKKHSNSWHKTLYGDHFAKFGLDSKARHTQAREEVDFLAKYLDLKKGSKVLDVPCGTARHSLAFGKLGMDVVAVDISPSCLRLARKNCKGLKNIEVKSGDMGKLSWAKNKFDLVTNMFSSFGYFKNANENKKVLEGFKNSLRPGGAIVIQTINREWLLKIFDPARWGESGDYYWQEGTRYEANTKYVEANRMFINKKTGKGERSYNRMQVYSIAEMKKLMKEVGLTNIKALGDISGKKADRLKSTHPIYIGFRSNK
jgi:ubiquinone/menaquinone biosynthesis C-methylase UbiE